jgi:type IV pilus assembly protein PilY1
MKKIVESLRIIVLLNIFIAFTAPGVSVAVMNDYSITPPFIQEAIKPNLLFMIDNSSSMYDLAYADDGKKVCSNSSSTLCALDSDCPSGGTCSSILRQPYYCYDQTYSNAKSYIGYFEPATLYQYNFTAKEFETATSAFSCTDSGKTTKSISNTLCVIYSSTAPFAVSKFLATGNYLNWLTASKFDVQKQILTGGKYVGTQLLAESRGCVGQSFVKEANTADFQHYNSPETNNPNTSLEITFGVRGPYDPYNLSAPSPGGQSYLDIYRGNYNQGDCQNAVYQLQYGGNADIKKAVDACLTSSYTESTAVTETKVAFQQSMQACWAYRNWKAGTGGQDIGTDDINTVKNQCTDIYSQYATCSNNPNQVCTADADCGTGNTCIYGPAAISAGNPALLCGSDYEGQYYALPGTTGICQKKDNPDGGACASDKDCTGGYKCSSSASAGWTLIPGTLESTMIQTHRDYCDSLDIPQVIDPTDAASDTSLYDNLPAIISGIGLEAQLNQPIATLDVKLNKSTAPVGLVQNFANLIRMGLMSYNFIGSATEAGVSVPVAKVCSNDTLKVCTSNVDCLSPGTCVTAATGSENKDGAAILHYIGYGHCSTTTTTACATSANCPSGEKCISAGVGNHTTGMIKAINDLKATSWTPFAESFYNAIGYYAKSSSDTSGKTSRTDLRINSTDFVATLNPSEYRCQNNTVLLITDGMSTADRNSAVDNLAKLYTAAGGSTSWTTTCPSYGGSVNLDNLAWIAKNRNINTFNATTLASTEVPTEKNQEIKTYVVFNGSSNGQSGECNSETLLANTASKGGTSLYKAANPAALAEKLETALKDIAAGSASGTAASIVSNRGQSGANLITAIFYPEKEFGNNQNIPWIGDLQNYWYYFDPFIANSTIREDTLDDDILDLGYDYKIDFVFDSALGKTMANRYRDNLNGTYTFVNQVTPDELEALWKAGTLLYKRNLVSSPRTILTSTNGISLLTNDFSTSNKATLYPYLNVSGTDETEKIAAAEKLIKYIHGYDAVDFRRRWATGYAGVTTNETNARTTGYGVWKLGDIISSTPKVQSDRPSSGYHLDYGDSSYQDFITSDDYAGRGMVYVGANDGMLHAITIGKVEKKTSDRGDRIAQTASNKGEEAWAYVPRNALPYLKYFADPNYTHLYYVDNTTLLVDASVKKHDDCSESVYYNCERQTKKTAGNDLIPERTSWRSILIGGMGLGGASRSAGGSCGSTTGTLPDCVTAPINSTGYQNVGLSSFFALDVTNPASPALKWEFSHEDLGYTLAEPVIVRINGENDVTGNPDSSKNGRWFVVFASGPTGPIEPGSHQFYGKSDKSLKLFVVDLEAQPPFDLGTDYWVIDKLHDNTTLTSALGNSFGGSLATNAIDIDKIDKISSGRYSTDVVYVGYVKEKNAAGSTTWADGGLLRLVTKESTDPGTWALSKVIDGDGIGPVTASIDKMYDDNGPDLWLYFGSGRYFYKSATDGIDSADQQMSLFGIKEPCYTANKKLDPSCTSSLDIGDLQDQSNGISSMAGKDGWYINLDDSGTYDGKVYKAERVITTPGVRTNGLVVFTTFKPTADICGFGGETLFWFVDYGTGGAPPPGTLKGKITIQLSTGAIVVVDLGKLTAGSFNRDGRQFSVGAGKPPSPAPQADTLKKPVKKILHIQER